MIPNFDEINDTVSQITFTPYETGTEKYEQMNTIDLYVAEDSFASVTIYFNGTTNPIILYLDSSCCEFPWFSTKNHITDETKFHVHERETDKENIKFLKDYNKIDKMIGKRIKSVDRQIYCHAHEEIMSNSVDVYPIKITMEDDTIVHLWMNVYSNGCYGGIFMMKHI